MDFFKDMLDIHVRRFELYSTKATDRFDPCREEYSRLAEAESRIIASLIARI